MVLKTILRSIYTISREFGSIQTEVVVFGELSTEHKKFLQKWKSIIIFKFDELVDQSKRRQPYLKQVYWLLLILKPKLFVLFNKPLCSMRQQFSFGIAH